MARTRFLIFLPCVFNNILGAICIFNIFLCVARVFDLRHENCAAGRSQPHAEQGVDPRPLKLRRHHPHPARAADVSSGAPSAGRDSAKTSAVFSSRSLRLRAFAWNALCSVAVISQVPGIRAGSRATRRRLSTKPNIKHGLVSRPTTMLACSAPMLRGGFSRTAPGRRNAGSRYQLQPLAAAEQMIRTLLPRSRDQV